MDFRKGYNLDSLVSKLRIRGMYADADRLEDDQRTNLLSSEAKEIVRREYGESVKEIKTYTSRTLGRKVTIPED